MKGMSQIIRSAEKILHKPWANIRSTPHPGEFLISNIFEVHDVSIQNHFVCTPLEHLCLIVTSFSIIIAISYSQLV